MQSQKPSTEQQERPQLPWGMGSARIKGRVWWITYRDPKGKIHLENSGTGDPAEAQRIMAQKALPRAWAMVAALEKLANAEPQGPNSKGGKRPRSGSVAPVGTAAAAAARKAGGKATRKGGKA